MDPLPHSTVTEEKSVTKEEVRINLIQSQTPTIIEDCFQSEAVYVLKIKKGCPATQRFIRDLSDDKKEVLKIDPQQRLMDKSGTFGLHPETPLCTLTRPVFRPRMQYIVGGFYAIRSCEIKVFVDRWVLTRLELRIKWPFQIPMQLLWQVRRSPETKRWEGTIKCADTNRVLHNYHFERGTQCCTCCGRPKIDPKIVIEAGTPRAFVPLIIATYWANEYTKGYLATFYLWPALLLLFLTRFIESMALYIAANCLLGAGYILLVVWVVMV